MDNENEQLEEQEPEEEQNELSLEQLSQAYAQVLKEHSEPGEVDADHADEEADPSAETDESSESGEDDEQASTDKKNKRKSKPPKSLDQLDADDNANCPISPKSIIESVLFVGVPSGEKITARKLAAVMRDVSPKEVKQVVKELNSEYERDNSAFRVVEDSGNFKLQLHPDLIEVQNHYFGRNRPARLSQNAIDVLAIVAYHQPISRAQVDKIRSKPSGGVLNQLQRRELLIAEKPEGSKEKQFKTTDRFLDLFGLESLDDLPQTSLGSDLQELADY